MPKGSAVVLIDPTTGQAYKAGDFTGTLVVPGDVTIHDDTTPSHKLFVDADGSIKVQFASGATIALDTATLAALENIVVSGTVALDATTLAALENTTVTIHDATTPAQKLAIDSSGRITVINSGTLTINSNNTSTTALLANGSFIGLATDLSNYAEIVIQLFAQPSTAAASLFFEFSPDGVNWDVSVPNILPDPTFFIPYPLIPVARYFRVRYINDGGLAAIAAGAAGIAVLPVVQTIFRFNTYLLTQPTKEIGRTLGQTVTDNQPVSLVRSALMGKAPSGAYLNVPVSAAGRVFTAPDTSTTPTTPDGSGLNNHGTIQGLTPFYPTIVSSLWGFGNAMLFDGVDRGSYLNNQGVDCGIPTGIGGNFTIEAKVVKTRTGVIEVIAAKASDPQVDFLFFFGGDKINIEVQDASSAGVSATGATTVSLGKHDVAADWDGANLRVYLDGHADGSTPLTTRLAINSDSFVIGRDNEVTAHGRPYAGTIEEVRLSRVARYAGANYTPAIYPFGTDANTTGLWHLDHIIGPTATTAIGDEFSNFEAQDVTLVAGTDTTITFVQPVRMVRVLNWDTINRVLVKTSAIATNTDAGATRVGIAPTASVPGSRTLPCRRSTLHLRSAGASNVTVEGYF